MNAANDSHYPPHCTTTRGSDAAGDIHVHVTTDVNGITDTMQRMW